MTTLEWKCPKCSAPLAMEDVNMATDMVLCRSCSQVSRCSELVQENQDEKILDSVPRRIRMLKTARGLEVTYQRRKGIGFFFLIFTLVWDGVTYPLLFHMLGSETGVSLLPVLFFVPFVLVGLGMLLATIYIFFGRIALTLKPGGGELFRGVGCLGRRQRFLLTKDTRISIEESRMQKNNSVLSQIRVEQPDGESFEFGTEIEKGNDQQYVAALLRQMRA